MIIRRRFDQKQTYRTQTNRSVQQSIYKVSLFLMKLL